MSGLRYAYITNGLADHRLDDALAMLADLGYSGAGLTLDHHHLDPYAPDLAARVMKVADRLRTLGLSVVIETGGRFVLDPRQKHEPTLLSTEGRHRRAAFLQQAVEIGADLGATAVSFWSGRKAADVDDATAWARLREGCELVLTSAHEKQVPLAFEPEPGMFLEHLSQWGQLSSELASPLFGLTMDIGHCHCIESEPPAECIRRHGAQLRQVHIEDMVKGVHDHLDFGEGTLDFPAALAALREVDYRGLVSVELSRHSHAADKTVPRAIEFLKARELR